MPRWTDPLQVLNRFMPHSVPSTAGCRRFYRDCIVGTIYEGTSNIQLNTIAKLISKQYTP